MLDMPADLRNICSPSSSTLTPSFMLFVDGIDEESGTVNVYALCPEPGDSVMIVNCGETFEIRRHRWDVNPLILTDHDIDNLKSGRIIWH